MDSTSEFYRTLLQSGPLDTFRKASPLAQILKHKRSPRHLNPLPKTPPSLPVKKLQDTEERERTRRCQQLPQLEARILRRQRVFLNVDGAAEIGYEEIIQYNEVESDIQQNPLALLLPKKCSTTDEIPLMPCFAKAHRYRLYEVEKWREPVRDRDKSWSHDELSVIQAIKQKRYPMTDEKLRSGKWKQIHQDNEHLLKRYGVMIDKSYVIVSAIGVNIFGRVYGAGLQSKRSIILNVYDPAFAFNHTMTLSMDDLEDLFQDYRGHLAAGRKEDLVAGIVAMLYFDYPPSYEDGKPAIPSLHINKEMKASASKLRRIQRERQRLLDEEQRRLEELRLLTMARRQRHRIIARSIKLAGIRFTVTVHQYPHQLRNFGIIAYHAPTGTQYSLLVGVHHAGKLARVVTPPHQWSKKERFDIASNVITFLRLVHNSAGETALSVDGRLGYYNTTVDLECADTPDSIAAKELRQRIANEITQIHEACYSDVRKINSCIAAVEKRFADDIKVLEESREGLKAMELSLREELEDVESNGLGEVDVTADKETKSLQKQTLREKRQRLKHERTSTIAQIKSVQQKITIALSQCQAENSQFNDEIKKRMLECEQDVAAVQESVSQPFEFHCKIYGDYRRAAAYTNGKRHRKELGATNKLAAGAATMEGRRCRYSAWFLDEDYFQFTFYFPDTSESTSFRCRKVSWCILSKKNARGEDLWPIQKEIPSFVYYPHGSEPPEFQIKLENLNTGLESMLTHLRRCDLGSRDALKCIDQMKVAVAEKRVIHYAIKRHYNHLVTALTYRLKRQEDQIIVNTLLFQSLQIELVTSSGESQVCDCRVHLENDQVVFYVERLVRQVHPYTDELVAELATESAMEMQVHLELIVTSMIITKAEDTGAVSLEFPD